MIRDKYKVYGELNDPDTVLSSGELPTNSFVVGAGNKGVKALIPGANKILTTDSYGNPITISYNEANKFLGTDENGNLAMVDPPVTPASVFNGFSSLKSRIVDDGMGTKYRIAAHTVQHDSNHIAYAMIELPSVELNQKFTIMFDTPLVLRTATKCYVAAEMCDAGIKCIFNNAPIYLCYETSAGATTLVALDNYLFSGYVTLPAGTCVGLCRSSSKAVSSPYPCGLRAFCTIIYDFTDKEG